VCRRPTYTLAILGNTLQTALLGMFAYWGPKAVTFMFHMQSDHADLIFGAVTVLSGIVGTLLGGLLLDALGGSARAAAGVCLGSCALGFVLLQLAFRLCYTIAPFVAVFAIGELVLFTLQSPVTRIILLSVPSDLRPMAFGIQTITIHVFGDVPSPPLAGWIHDKVFNADDVVRRCLSPLLLVLFLLCAMLAGELAPANCSARIRHTQKALPMRAWRVVYAFTCQLVC
jgi:MFS transporter, Spinster family, sphingosine-1-phosphate transporter